MIYYIGKIAISAILITIVSELAKRSSFAGLILPLFRYSHSLLFSGSILIHRIASEL